MNSDIAHKLIAVRFPSFQHVMFKDEDDLTSTYFVYEEHNRSMELFFMLLDHFGVSYKLHKQRFYLAPGEIGYIKSLKKDASWFLSRKERNRRAHSKNGNILSRIADSFDVDVFRIELFGIAFIISGSLIYLFLLRALCLSLSNQVFTKPEGCSSRLCAALEHIHDTFFLRWLFICFDSRLSRSYVKYRFVLKNYALSPSGMFVHFMNHTSIPSPVALWYSALAADLVSSHVARVLDNHVYFSLSEHTCPACGKLLRFFSDDCSADCTAKLCFSNHDPATCICSKVVIHVES